MTYMQYISVIPSNTPVNNIPSNTPVNNITFVLIQLHYFMTRTFKKMHKPVFDLSSKE